MLDNIDAIYDKDGKHIGFLRRSTIAEVKESLSNECPVPPTTETDPAKKIADEQTYMICRFQSLQKLMFDLQAELVRRDCANTGVFIRRAYRHIKDAEDNYLLESRKKLSDIVNKDKKLPPSIGIRCRSCGHLIEDKNWHMHVCLIKSPYIGTPE